MEIKETRAVSITEAKLILQKRKEEGELGYEQNQALENSEKFSSKDQKELDKMVKELTKEGKISEETAKKLIDISPNNPSTLKAVLLKDKVDLSEEEIASVIKKLE
ncbi:MAG: hypothetical protein ACP5N9_04100 [Candidatus Bilamarchaeum sp.]|jgi:DNA-directed RNA polymerase subunit F